MNKEQMNAQIQALTEKCRDLYVTNQGLRDILNNDKEKSKIVNGMVSVINNLKEALQVFAKIEVPATVGVAFKSEIYQEISDAHQLAKETLKDLPQ